MKKVKLIEHRFWHHLFMVVYSEFINFVWLFTGVAISLGGWVIFTSTTNSFYRIAMGLPLLLLGLSIIILKLGEIFLVILKPKRLKAVCIFCNKPVSGPDETGK